MSASTRDGLLDSLVEPDPAGAERYLGQAALAGHLAALMQPAYARRFEGFGQRLAVSHRRAINNLSCLASSYPLPILTR